MDDNTPTRKDRQFHTGEDGADTVRILPGNASPSDQEEWFIEEHPARHGALYTPPASPDHATGRPSPAEPSGPPEGGPGKEHGLQPYNSTPIQPPTVPANVTHVHKGPSACAIVAATLGILVLACALLAFATLKNGFDGIGKLAGVFPGIITSPTVTIDTSRPTIVDEVRALSKLETVHYQLEKVVTGKSSGPLPDFLTSDKILLVAHGEVVGGVDLSNITANDVTVVSNTVTIRLPKPEVLYSKLDNDKTYVYDRQTGIFSKPDPNLESQIRQAAEQDILNTAIEDGILDQARTNAQTVLRTLLSALGYKQVTFTEGP